MISIKILSYYKFNLCSLFSLTCLYDNHKVTNSKMKESVYVHLTTINKTERQTDRHLDISFSIKCG